MLVLYWNKTLSFQTLHLFHERMSFGQRRHRTHDSNLIYKLWIPRGSDAAHLIHQISPTLFKCAVYEACESSVCSSRVYREVRERQAAVSNWFCVQVTAIQLQALQHGTDKDELRWQDLTNKRNVWIISEKKQHQQ